MGKEREINSVRDLCEFQVTRNTNRLCRNILNYLEDIQADQKMQLSLILEKIPEEYREKIELTHVLSDEKMAHIRKRILDHANNFLRDLSMEMQNFKIEFKF